MKDMACVLLIVIEGDGKAAIMMIILSMTKKSYLIVNNGFLIDKLIINPFLTRASHGFRLGPPPNILGKIHILILMLFSHFSSKNHYLAR